MRVGGLARGVRSLSTVRIGVLLRGVSLLAVLVRLLLRESIQLPSSSSSSIVLHSIVGRSGRVGELVRSSGLVTAVSVLLLLLEVSLRVAGGGRRRDGEVSVRSGSGGEVAKGGSSSTVSVHSVVLSTVRVLVRRASSTTDQLHHFRFGQSSSACDGAQLHSTHSERVESGSENGRSSDGGSDLLDRSVVLTLHHSPDGLEGDSESGSEFSNVLDLLVALASSPRESDSRLAVDREVVHLGDREFGVGSSDELNESTSLSGRDLAVRDLPKVMEERLWHDARISTSTNNERKKRTLRVSSLMQAGRPPTKTVVLLGSVVCD